MRVATMAQPADQQLPSLLPITGPCPTGVVVQPLHRDAPALVCAIILPASQGCQEWALPDGCLEIICPIPSMHPVVLLTHGRLQFSGCSEASKVSLAMHRVKSHSRGCLLEPLILLGSPFILLWVQA